MAKGGLAVVKDGDGWMQPLSKADLDVEEGSSFGFQERLFYAFEDGMVLDYGNWEAIDLHAMLDSDYKSRQIYNAITLPSLSTRKHIEPAKGDSGEFDFVSKVFAYDADAADPLNGAGCQTPLDDVVAHMMSAAAYKRSFHEKVWVKGKGDLDGYHIYGKLAYRPATTCRVMRHPRTGEIVGFEQDSYLSGGGITLKRKQERPRIPRRRALVHIHGSWIDPINGISVMEVPYWAYKTKQKLLFLWFQYLEGVALPRSAVISDDETTSKRTAAALRKTKNSGAVPVWSNNPANTRIETLDLSGSQGAGEFMKAIAFLDGCATQEILAGFLDLTSQANNGTGSYALSADGSDFYLQSCEARNREIEASVRREIFAPLIRWNFGPKARVPHYRMDALTAESKLAAVEMLKSLLASRDPSTAVIPHEFIGELATKVAGTFGMDVDKIRISFEQAAKDSAQLIAAQSQAMRTSAVGQQTAALNGVATKAIQTAQQVVAGGKP